MAEVSTEQRDQPAVISSWEPAACAWLVRAFQVTVTLERWCVPLF